MFIKKLVTAFIFVMFLAGGVAAPVGVDVSGGSVITANSAQAQQKKENQKKPKKDKKKKEKKKKSDKQGTGKKNKGKGQEHGKGLKKQG